MLQQLFQVLIFIAASFTCSLTRAVYEPHGEVSLQLSPLQLSTNTPDFLRATYDCWSSGNSLYDCVPYSTRPKFDDVNIIRAIKGTVYEEASFLQYFNLSTLQTEHEKLQYMYIRLSKEALSVEKMVLLQKKCNIHYGIPLTLTMRTFSNGVATSIFQDTIIINLTDIKEEMIVNFTDILPAYSSSTRDSKPSTKITFELNVSGLCQHLLTPMDLGFIPSIDQWLVTFSVHSNSDSKNIFSELMKNSENVHYARRQTNESLIDPEETELYITNEGPCRMHTQWVPFTELEFENNIVRPEGFHINYCSGICSFPQISSSKYNTTKHSHIQSIAAHYNPDSVPTPCCVPHEYSSVGIVYEKFPGVIAMHTFSDIAVKSCGCK